MTRFRDHDYVELCGETLDDPVELGSRGFIVHSFSEYDDYLVEFVDDDGEMLELATVHATNLRLLESVESLYSSTQKIAV